MIIVGITILSTVLLNKQLYLPMYLVLWIIMLTLSIVECFHFPYLTSGCILYGGWRKLNSFLTSLDKGIVVVLVEPYHNFQLIV